MEKEKITYEQMCDASFRRNVIMETKKGAVWQIFFELGGLINVSKFAKMYLNKSQSWFMQRVNGYDVNHKKAEFTSEQYKDISNALRSLGDCLKKYAEELDKAEI